MLLVKYRRFLVLLQAMKIISPYDVLVVGCIDLIATNSYRKDVRGESEGYRQYDNAGCVGNDEMYQRVLSVVRFKVDMIRWIVRKHTVRLST